jgi:ribosomal protein S18 acetylase RimI-like enzyme
MELRSTAYRTDLVVRRAGGSEIEDAGDHIIVRSPQNPTFYWGNFILIGEDGEPGDHRQWLDVFARTFPDAGHVSVGIDSQDGAAGIDLGGYLAAGLEPELNVVLTADALAPPARELTDAEIRPLGEDDWPAAVSLRQATAIDEGNDTDSHRLFLERRVADTRRLVDTGTAVWFGAFTEEGLSSILGIVADAQGLARYQDVETHPARRRRGLAGWLVYAAGRHAIDSLGARRLVIVADPEGPAIGLYRSLGLRESERQIQLGRTPTPS